MEVGSGRFFPVPDVSSCVQTKSWPLSSPYSSPPREEERVILWPCCASLAAQTVKNLPAVQETWVRSLCWEDPLEEGMATHSSILAWRIPWTEEPAKLQSMGSQRAGHD